MAGLSKPQKSFHRACAFCRRPAKMTHEHVWGQWRKPYVSRKSNSHSLSQVVIGRLGAIPQHKMSTRAGPSPLYSTVPVVCLDCNSGWLSQIQNNARPHLVPLIEGKTSHLVSMEAQVAIVTWATMATITAEFISRRLATIAVSIEAREAFMSARRPLANWRIWMGYYRRRTWDAAYVHACQPIHHETDMIVPNLDVGERHVPLPTTQWSTFSVGYLYLHIASSSRASDLISGWDWLNAPRARRRDSYAADDQNALICSSVKRHSLHPLLFPLTVCDRGGGTNQSWMP